MSHTTSNGAGLDCTSALLAVKAALRHAVDKGWRVSVAVLDGGGHLLAFARAVDAPLHTIEIAQDKAFTAVSFAMSTDELASRLCDAPEHVRSGLLMRPRLIALGGAIPFYAGDRLVGAIGVSGASEEQDRECATVGYRAIVPAGSSFFRHETAGVNELE